MIYLLRHGQTLWNVEGRFQGQKDSPLTTTGIGQAQRVAKLLQRIVPDLPRCKVIASPLGRTWQTASIVCEELDLDPCAIAFDPRLMEYHYGDWQGRLVADVKAEHPEAWTAHQADRWNYRFPGGESYDLVATRVTSWLAEQRTEQPVIAVSHGLSGRVLRGVYAGLSKDAILDLPEEHEAVHLLSNGQFETVMA